MLLSIVMQVELWGEKHFSGSFWIEIASHNIIELGYITTLAA